MSVRTRSTVLNALALAAIAVLFTFVFPVGGQQVADTVHPVYNQSHITTNTTTTAQTGAGVLHTICINTKGAAANVATVYDNTAGSGTVIAVIDTTAQVNCQYYDARLQTGLTIVTATGTPADLTATYRRLN